MIVVAQDLVGLKGAMLELLELELTAEYRSREEDEPARKHAAGYFAWIDYLVMLQEWRKNGFNPELTADEIEGLTALQQARDEFQSEHPPCSSCGALQYNHLATRCRRCRAEFKRTA